MKAIRFKYDNWDGLYRYLVIKKWKRRIGELKYEALEGYNAYSY
jgi:hypothetical protein